MNKNVFGVLFHFFLLLTFNIILAIKRRRNLQTDLSLYQITSEQVHQNRHLLISSCILIILLLPRLIISFLARCMQSNSSPWIYLIGYLVSFLLSMLIFVIFVLPSKLYLDEFQKGIQQCQQTFRRLISCFPCLSS